jgi:dipeptidyl aminopeptidase/acylaminoacyl peptidase
MIEVAMRIALRCLVGLVVAAVPVSRVAAQAPPSTDVFLAALSSSGATVAARAPRNVTNRAGYDNQPSFTPDGRSLLFTSVRDDGQADIYRYDLGSSQTTRVTSTAESEYSATVTPDARRFSVIRVERDSTQRLWSFALDGSDPRLVIASLAPVGYHVWIDANRIAMFVLGRPNALVIGDLKSGRMDTVARNVGRSLARLPDGRGFSFVQIADSTSMLRGMDPATHRTWDVVRLPRGVQDIVWLRDGRLLAASGARLIMWKQGDAAWHDVANFSSVLTDASRLAVSPDERWLAIVALPLPKAR